MFSSLRRPGPGRVVPDRDVERPGHLPAEQFGRGVPEPDRLVVALPPEGQVVGRDGPGPQPLDLGLPVRLQSDGAQRALQVGVDVRLPGQPPRHRHQTAELLDALERHLVELDRRLERITLADVQLAAGPERPGLPGRRGEPRQLADELLDRQLAVTKVHLGGHVLDGQFVHRGPLRLDGPGQPVRLELVGSLGRDVHLDPHSHLPADLDRHLDPGRLEQLRQVHVPEGDVDVQVRLLLAGGVDRLDHAGGQLEDAGHDPRPSAGAPWPAPAASSSLDSSGFLTSWRTRSAGRSLKSIPPPGPDVTFSSTSGIFRPWSLAWAMVALPTASTWVPPPAGRVTTNSTLPDSRPSSPGGSFHCLGSWRTSRFVQVGHEPQDVGRPRRSPSASRAGLPRRPPSRGRRSE